MLSFVMRVFRYIQHHQGDQGRSSLYAKTQLRTHKKNQLKTKYAFVDEIKL